MPDRGCEHAAARYGLRFAPEPAAEADAGSPAPAARREWRMDRLLSPLEMDRLLEAFGRAKQTPHAAIAGSLFVKMYARMLTGAWKLLSVHNVRVNLTLSEVVLVWPETDTDASIRLPDTAGEPLPEQPGERNAVRDRWLQETIERHLRPLIETVSFRSGLSKAVLWENVFIYLHHGYEEWRQEAESDAERSRILADYAALTEQGGPFHIPSGSFEHPLHPGKQLRIRRTCCLKYALPDGTPCYSCPNLCISKRKQILLGKNK
jgi:ferric iron reductase protein FhuF